MSQKYVKISKQQTLVRISAWNAPYNK